LEAVHDFMSYVEDKLFNKQSVKRQFHTNIDQWEEMCYKGYSWTSMQRLDQTLDSPMRDEYGAALLSNWHPGYLGWLAVLNYNAL